MTSTALGRQFRAAVLAGLATQIPLLVLGFAAEVEGMGFKGAGGEFLSILLVSNADDLMLVGVFAGAVFLAGTYFLGVTAWLRHWGKLSLLGLLVVAGITAMGVEALCIVMNLLMHRPEYAFHGLGLVFALAAVPLVIGSLVWWWARPQT